MEQSGDLKAAEKAMDDAIMLYARLVILESDDFPVKGMPIGFSGCVQVAGVDDDGDEYDDFVAIKSRGMSFYTASGLLRAGLTQIDHANAFGNLEEE